MPADTMSRIPRFQSSGDQFMNGTNGHSRTISAPSKLEQLQADFQARRLKEKEERMLQVYKEQEQRNMERAAKYSTNFGSNITNQGGSGKVRQFLQERRQGGGTVSNRGMASKPPIPGYQKNSAGRDRANPLVPINRGSAGSNTSSRSTNRGGMYGDGSSPSGVTYSPKPPPHGKPKLPRRRFGTPNDSGNESSGFEDQNKNFVPHREAKLYRKKQQFNQYPASSDEDLSKQNSFTKWQNQQQQARQMRQNVPSTTASNNGYNSDGPVTDFQRWQAKQDQDRAERLKKHQEQKNNSENDLAGTYTVPSKRKLSNKSPSVPNQESSQSVRRQQQKRTPTTQRKLPQRQQNRDYDDSDDGQGMESSRSNQSRLSRASNASMERSRKLETELKKKEEDLLRMITEQQKELESLKQQRQKDEEEEDRAEMERTRRHEQLTRERKLREAEEREYKERQKERERQRSQLSARSTATSDRPPTQPSPSPVIATKPKMIKPKPKVEKRKPPPAPPSDEEPFFDTRNAAAYYIQSAEVDPDAVPVNLNLVACSNCGRKFAADRIAKHNNACKKVAKAASKRKVFDPVKMRTEGTEMAKYACAPKKPEKKANKGDWRKKREDFINALRYAKQVTAVEKQGGSVADLPPPPVTENDHYKQCPYCDRRFAPETAERHIPRCKDIKSRPAPPKRRGR